MTRSKNMKNPFITQSPSNLLQCLSFVYSLSPRKNPRTSNSTSNLCSSPNLSFFFLFLLTVLAFFGVSKVISLAVSATQHCSSLIPPTFFSPFSSSFSSPFFHCNLLFSSLSMPELPTEAKLRLSHSGMVPLPAHRITGNMTDEEREFWRQPENAGFRPCLEFSIKYRRTSTKISKEKLKYLVVVASGGLNQQRNQIVDAVVIARILEAALVVPVLQVNFIWGDESEFSDIFDVEHFKKTLQADVRVVLSLPSTHLVSRQTVETQIPFSVSPGWIRARFLKTLNREGVLILKGLDSKLSKNLPSDLQKLRCKVAFHALRFAAPIRELGNRLARRIWVEGPYIALHMRLEKDVWIRTGCQTGLGQEFDEIIERERKSRTEFLTGRTNLSYAHRRLAGLCPLNAQEVARLLKALGAPGNARIYLAGGEPFGGEEALKPLKGEFPNLMTKEMLARGQELEPYANKSSALAAIDYIVSLSSDVFMASHGGNMGRAMQGQRLYVGHKKYIMPNKRAMLPFFENGSVAEEDFSKIMKQLHISSTKPPQARRKKKIYDVIAYPVLECMCQG